ncbi:MAG: cytochrome b [Caldimonas manganoxidans]|uniref:cytochrome b n=1 Tax=Caldimonas taiwanensis TaxID=307483 RepID=UPI000783248B|nr:cytochrome b [Caldimonas taiwanensis]MCX7660467.1 cytochrome b [Caldimonas manganoxidans]GIX24005.1 MAG: type-b cytochrome [Caldimonas sp.]
MPAASDRYTSTAIVLHWLLALGLLGMLALGMYMTELPMSPARLKLYNWHKWAGIVILALSIWRLSWRWTHRPPALPPHVLQHMPTWQRIAHQGTHGALYCLFFAVPLVGWAYSSAAGFPVVLFGWLPLPDFVPADRALAEALKPWHGLLAYALAALIVLHVLGALKHQFIDRDGLLRRMWWGR